ncbi:hypothetical protein BSF42_38030 [Flavobacterium sp. ACN6]|nr:hypothetical protein BSF42_38030 [Flavobacterium sp. ACN6]
MNLVVIYVFLAEMFVSNINITVGTYTKVRIRRDSAEKFIQVKLSLKIILTFCGKIEDNFKHHVPRFCHKTYFKRFQHS